MSQIADLFAIMLVGHVELLFFSNSGDLSFSFTNEFPLV